jgi:hypothetical protein
VSPVAIVGMTIVQMIAIRLMLRRARWTDFKPIGLPNVRLLISALRTLWARAIKYTPRSSSD